jgi:hypothetical protein
MGGEGREFSGRRFVRKARVEGCSAEGCRPTNGDGGFERFCRVGMQDLHLADIE